MPVQPYQPGDPMNQAGFAFASVTDWMMNAIIGDEEEKDETPPDAMPDVSPGLPPHLREPAPRPSSGVAPIGLPGLGLGSIVSSPSDVAPPGSKSDPLRLQQPPRDSESDALSGPAAIIFQTLLGPWIDDQQVYEGWVEYWSDSAVVVQLKEIVKGPPRFVLAACNGLDGTSLDTAIPRLWKGRLIPVANTSPQSLRTSEWVCLWWFQSRTECVETPLIFTNASSSVG